jgi:hypothetical protein
MDEGEKQGGDLWNKFIIDSLNRGTAPVIILQGTGSGVGLDAMLSAAITGTWTAFETMAGDLWETALNVHPNILAQLRGKKKRQDAGPDEDDDDKENKKYVPLSEILRFQYDLRNNMGSVHRRQRLFDRLSGIREAYSQAFSKDFADVDKALSPQGIDALNAVRNLIVHRSGVVDQDYERKCKYLPVPKAELGKPILLDGEITRGLMLPVIVAAFDLLKAVDRWFGAN